jgi:hypothetical protein
MAQLHKSAKLSEEARYMVFDPDYYCDYKSISSDLSYYIEPSCHIQTQKKWLQFPREIRTAQASD